MFADPKPMLRADAADEFRQFIALKLDQFAALGAIKVIVLGIAVVVFVDRPPVQLKAVEKPCIDELFQGSIDRRLTDVIFLTLAWQIFDQSVGVKMLMSGEDLLHQETPLLGLSKPATLQIFFEALLRRQRNINTCQRSLIGSHRNFHLHLESWWIIPPATLNTIPKWEYNRLSSDLRKIVQ
jgi:hypothetical protein